MPPKPSALFWILGVVLLVNGCGKDNGHTNLKGPYLGQPPPGDVPELFAPGVVSSIYREHSGAVFTPDGRELFWSRAINEGRKPRIVVIMHMKQDNQGFWSRPELAPFNLADYNHVNSVSPDGRRLYLFSETGGAWIVHKTEEAWGAPVPLLLNESDRPGRHLNEVHETRNGDLYLMGPLYKGRGIVRAPRLNNGYGPYESLGSHVNLVFDDPYPNHSPTVDPDGRFVIFVSRRPGGYGTQDLYISYRLPDDSWSEAFNLGEKINTVGVGNSWPQLSPDGKYLFFTSTVRPYGENAIADKRLSYDRLIAIQEHVLNGWDNIYWVSTNFVEKLKTSHMTN